MKLENFRGLLEPIKGGSNKDLDNYLIKAVRQCPKMCSVRWDKEVAGGSR